MVYSWTHPLAVAAAGQRGEDSLPLITKAVNEKGWRKAVVPGLSSVANNPTLATVGAYLTPLLDFASSVVPPSQQPKTPLYLLATAGMRLVPQLQRLQILSLSCEYVKGKYSFSMAAGCQRQFRVISGDLEAVFGWVAVNYLKQDGFAARVRGVKIKTTIESGDKEYMKDEDDNIESEAAAPTYGFLELGGASAQVAIEVDDTVGGYSDAVSSFSTSLIQSSLLSSLSLPPTPAVSLATMSQDHNQRAYPTLSTSSSIILSSSPPSLTSPADMTSRRITLRTIHGLDHTFRVDVTSFLGFGVNEARRMHVEYLASVQFGASGATMTAKTTTTMAAEAVVGKDRQFASNSSAATGGISRMKNIKRDEGSENVTDDLSRRSVTTTTAAVSADVVPLDVGDPYNEDNDALSMRLKWLEGNAEIGIGRTIMLGTGSVWNEEMQPMKVDSSSFSLPLFSPNIEEEAEAVAATAEVSSILVPRAVIPKSQHTRGDTMDITLTLLDPCLPDGLTLVDTINLTSMVAKATAQQTIEVNGKSSRVVVMGTGVMDECIDLLNRGLLANRDSSECPGHPACLLKHVKATLGAIKTASNTHERGYGNAHTRGHREQLAGASAHAYSVIRTPYNQLSNANAAYPVASERRRGVLKLIGSAEFYYTPEAIFGLGGPYKYDDLDEAANEYCGLGWVKILERYGSMVPIDVGDGIASKTASAAFSTSHHLIEPTSTNDRQRQRMDYDGDHNQAHEGVLVDEKRLRMQCFKVSWLKALLHDGFGIQRSLVAGDDKDEDSEGEEENGDDYDNDDEAGYPRVSLFSAIEIDGTPITWTLGAMLLHVASTIPPSVSVEDGDGQSDSVNTGFWTVVSWLATLFIIIVLALLIGLVVCKRKRRSKSLLP